MRVLLPLSLSLWFPARLSAVAVHAPIFRGGVHRTDEGDLSFRTSRRGSSEQVVSDIGSDEYYYTQIEIGTPPQTFNFLIDMSRGDLVVAGSTCQGPCPQSASQRYDSSSSTTAEEKSTAVSPRMLFGIGIAVEGLFVSDEVRLGSLAASSVEFTQVTQVVRASFPSDMSGILGLGAFSLVQTPFWKALIAQEELDMNGFSFWIQRKISFQLTEENPGSRPPAGPGPGALVFGGVNTSLYSGEIEFLPAPSFWTLQISAITVQGKSVDIDYSQATVTFDAGYGYITGPAADVAAIWAAVPGSISSGDAIIGGGYAHPCTTEVNITVSFGGRPWSISPVDMNLSPFESGLCTGGIFAVNTAATNVTTNWVFGSPFLKNVYSVFRQDPPSIGFAELSPAAGGTGTLPAILPGTASSSGVSANPPSTTSPAVTQATNPSATNPAVTQATNSSATNPAATQATNSSSTTTPAVTQSTASSSSRKSSVAGVIVGVVGGLCGALTYFVVWWM